MKKITLLAIFLLSALFVTAQVDSGQRLKRSRDVKVMIETNMGNIIVRLYGDTPIHRNNFLKLVSEGTYDGLLFHRVIDNFMVQAGDPLSREAKQGQLLGMGSLGYTIPNEIRSNHIHKRGALCAAREGNEVNPFRESSASQFYIVLGNEWKEEMLNDLEHRLRHKLTKEQREYYLKHPGTPHLDGEYTVFGEVVEGMEVIEKIGQSKVDENNRPENDIRILTMRVIEK